MNGVAIALTLATLGVDYSVGMTEEGHVEYTIQIEQEFLKSLAEGEEILSDVPPEAGSVQRICIRIGKTPVRHTATARQEYKRLLVSASRLASSDPALTGGEALSTILWPSRTNPVESFGVDYGWQPAQDGQLEYYIQIDPTTLKTLAAGDEIHAAIDPAVGRVGRFLISSGNTKLPRIAPPPAEAGAFAPKPTTRGGTRFQTGDDAGAPLVTNLPPAGNFRGGDDASAPSASPAGSRFNSTRDANASDLRAPALEPPAGGYTGGAPFEAPRTEFNQPATTRPPATYNPPLENNFVDNRPYSPAPAASGGRFDQYGSNALQPPVDASPPPSYVQPAQAQQPQYQQPTTRYSPQVPTDRFASAPPTTSIAATIPPRTTEASLPAATLPAAAVTPPLAKDQSWWPYWLFLVFSLFLSIGGNLYLGWTAAEFYSRYRLAVDRLRTAGRA